MDIHAWEKELVDRHGDYSRCMARFYRFKRAEGDAYGEKFGRLLKERDGGAEEIHECLHLTKDYWKKVRAFCTRFGCVEGNYRVDNWKSQHKRFAAVVRDLNANATDCDICDGGADGDDGGAEDYCSWEHVKTPDRHK